MIRAVTAGTRLASGPKKPKPEGYIVPEEEAYELLWASIIGQAIIDYKNEFDRKGVTEFFMGAMYEEHGQHCGEYILKELEKHYGD